MRVKQVLKSYVGGVHMGERPAAAWPRTELTAGLAERGWVVVSGGADHCVPYTVSLLT